MMDKEKIKEGVRLILEGIGEDTTRAGILRTPQRVADMYEDVFSGLQTNLEDKFNSYPVTKQDDMILMKNIPFYSFCEHHLLPFWGHASIAYIPKNDRIVGFSTLIKVVEHFAKRPQVQEQMTTQICEFLNDKLDPAGLLVVIRATHLCISMQGVKKEDSQAVTSAMRGYMRKQATRMEALLLLGQGEH